MARPKKKIDPEQVRKLALIDCSYSEMAAVLGCSVKTLQRGFDQVIKDGKEHGKMSLKRAQWRNAIDNNNVQMQIWLGKQRLGQRDKKDIEHTGEVIAHEAQSFSDLGNAVRDALEKLNERKK